jgi:hypothetical protein
LFQTEAVEFEEACAFGAEELLFASEGAEFFFEVFLSACEVFELEAEPSLEVALFGEEGLAFLFDFFAESLLFGIYVLAELFALSLEFFGLQSEFLEGGFVGELSFVIACSEAGDFIGECLAENFGEALFFVSQFCLGFCDAVGGFVSVAFVLEP